MEPAVTRSIGQGFAAANKSWAGIACYAAGWLVLAGFAVLSVLMTNPPAEVFKEPQAAESEQVPAPKAEPPAAVGTETAGPVTVFNQMEMAQPPAVAPAQAEVPQAEPPAATDATKTASAQDEQRRRVLGQWFSRAWPLLLFSLLLFIAGSSLLNAGQIGYAAKRIIAQQAAAKDFWAEGLRAFLPLLGGSLLALLGLGGFLLAFMLLAALFSRLPQAAGAVLAVLLITVMMAALVWLVVRLSFWFVVIVVERLGPLAALKASFRITKGRWWKLAGLGCLMALISYGATLGFAVVQWVGNAIGGPAAAILGLLGQLAAAVVGVYVGFAALAAYIRFYADAKSGTAGPGPSAA